MLTSPHVMSRVAEEYRGDLLVSISRHQLALHLAQVRQQPAARSSISPIETFRALRDALFNMVRIVSRRVSIDTARHSQPLDAR